MILPHVDSATCVHAHQDFNIFSLTLALFLTPSCSRSLSLCRGCTFSDGRSPQTDPDATGRNGVYRCEASFTLSYESKIGWSGIEYTLQTLFLYLFININNNILFIYY